MFTKTGCVNFDIHYYVTMLNMTLSIPTVTELLAFDTKTVLIDIFIVKHIWIKQVISAFEIHSIIQIYTTRI